MGFSELLGLWLNNVPHFGKIARALFSVIPSFLSLFSFSSSCTGGRLSHVVPELLDVLFSHSSLFSLSVSASVTTFDLFFYH